ncbi:hypothetical protein [Thiothrix subterranea]|nr:hypothetical protein [Thiothrix subterranea]
MSLLISSPHTHSGKSVHSTMLLVMLALAPRLFSACTCLVCLPSACF